MKKKDVRVAEARSPAAKVDEQPLLRALVARAAVQGDTLVMLAKQLGVTYERLAQLRRSPGAISNVHQSVLMNAASYLGVPPILAFVMARRIDLQHLAWPSAWPLETRVSRQLEQMRQDPFLGGFVPAELQSAAPSVQLFVLFMHSQLQGQGGQNGMHWMAALQKAVVGASQAPARFDEMSKQNSDNFPVF